MKQILWVGMVLAGCGIALAQTPAEQRTKARKLRADGNHAEAYQAYRAYVFTPGLDPVQTAEDLRDGVASLQQLQRVKECDGFVEEVLKAHGDRLPVVVAAARAYLDAPPHGFLIAGQFERGGHRGGGERASAWERDRGRALQILANALPLAAGKDTDAGLLYTLADALPRGRQAGGSWRLLDKTDLTTLPDYEKGGGWGWGWGGYEGSDQGGAPVDETGNPVYHAIPESWEKAANDGERWRWVLAQWEKQGGKYAAKAMLAEFANSQFGTETLARYGTAFQDDELATTGVWALHTLGDDETIAQLATGAKRFALPPDFQYLRLAKELAVEQGHWADRVAQLYQNRRQFPAAADAWRAAIAKHGKNDSRQQSLDQIVKPWVRIEGTRTQTPVNAAVFDLVHRNANSVAFRIQRLDMEALIADVQALLKRNPQQTDWWQTQIEQLGVRMVEGNGAKYLREEVAAWTRKLQPRAGHFDVRETVSAPLALKPGAYIVTGRAADGNESRAVLWIADTVLLRKTMAAARPQEDEGPQLVAVLDAETGKPLDGVSVEFFSWRQRYNDVRKGGRRVDFLTKSLTMKTDAEGLAVPPVTVWRDGNDWWQTVLIARGADGRFAFSGFERVWWGHGGDSAPTQPKPYGITDRPVYRPGNKVQFKVWVATPDYGAADASPWASRKIGVIIHNPKGEVVSDTTYVADAFGGLDGKFSLPAEAPLGVYSLQVRLSNIGTLGACSFRVEEYKKPEFEVSVKAPEKPVALGDRIEATVTATYTFGAPVAQGKAKVKVTRSAATENWWPEMPWDWLYGLGYAWYGYDYEWYPGWGRWGLWRPVPSWWWRPAPPPEVVLEMERPLNPDGTVTVAFDTALAKAMYGKTDHRYSISAEVTDLSRRTIVGQGQVLVAREPFRVYAWTDRSLYRAGDDVVARAKAQTPDHQPVRGAAELTLYRVASYDAEGQPKEEKVRAWTLTTDADGEVRQTLAATRKGQYRIVCRVTDGEKRTLEGGQVFTVRGDGDDGRDYRFANLELVPDKPEYSPGQTARLQVNTDAAGSSVMLFLRPVNGAVQGRPQWLHLAGKTAEVPIQIAAGDRPNFFVEAVTVRGGRVHTEARELVVPPDERVVHVDVVPDAAKVLPGGAAAVTVKLTDSEGKPCDASVALSVYDKAVDYIAGGSNVPEIRAFFWNWRRKHQPRSQHTLERDGETYLLKNEQGMEALGLFGGSIADEQELTFGIGGGGGMRRDRGIARKAAPGAPMAMKAVGMAMMDAAPMAAAAAPMEELAMADGGANGAVAAPEFAAATVRSEFADTAYWSPALKSTGEKGVYRATFKMPEDLTGWKTRAWAMGPGVRVGEGATEIVTAKNLMVRLQAPRFFTQRDEVVLSANVHNFLPAAKTVRAILELDGKDGAAAEFVEGAATQDVAVDAQGEKRVDWRVRVTQPGQLTVRMKALTDVESDAMERTFPVQVHGMLKTEAWSGVVRSGAGQGGDSATVRFRVPAERRPEQTRFEVRWSPTLAGAMLDALPYLLDYPYGCTEQTLNRFLPAVVTRHALRELGLDLEAVRQRQTNLNPQELGDDKARMAQWKRFDRNPVFDPAEMDKIVADGLDRLRQMQLGDGGWGWFSGFGEHSGTHTTATVVRGLRLAREAGVEVPVDMTQRGVAWLRDEQKKRIAWIAEKRKERRASDLDALVAMVLADEGFSDARMLDWLYEDREGLSLYSKAMLGLAYDRLKDARRDMLARNCVQFLKEDAENQSAWFDLGNADYWWQWYGSENEAQAYGLMLLVRTQPKSEATAGLVKYLLNNRKHATYWNSTRDTALCVEAMAAFLKTTGEGKSELTVEVKLDGKLVKTVVITPDRLLDFDNAFVVEGLELGDGEHVLEVARRGEGPLYFNAYLTNFTLEDPITAAGLEVKVQRQIYRLKDVGKDATGRGTRGQSVAQRREKYERIALKPGEWVASGDLLEIELVVDSKNDYEYLVFEDMKAAGCEPVEVRSGYTDQGLPAYVEYRDNRVAFFVRQLMRGKHSVTYRVRAEIPGRFSALPTRGWAMYAPELRANSDEAKLEIRDAPAP